MKNWALFFQCILLCFCLNFISIESKSSIIPLKVVSKGESCSPFLAESSSAYEKSVLSLRCGSDEESDYDDDEDADEGATDSSVIISKTLEVSKKIFRLVGKATISTAKACMRAVSAGLEGEVEDDENDEPQGVATKIIKRVKRMIQAAFTFDEESGDLTGDKKFSPKSKSKKEINSDDFTDDEGEVSSDDDDLNSDNISTRKDFGTFLSKSYAVSDNRDDSGPVVMGGTLGDALKVARSQARMLVVFTPMAKPGSKKNKASKDQLAISSVLSSEVAAAANKRARKKGEDSGSFLFWGAKAGSSEATAAIKRLKVKTKTSKGEKRPTLAVVYPAQTVDSSGVPRVVPKVLAQHHCSPPPSATVMAAWLNALRKRHSKQYVSMQTEMKEMMYFKERKEGYRDSVQNDIERKEREKVEEARRAAELLAEKKHIEYIEKRRQELKDTLAEEDDSDDAKKIAVRFQDGRAGQRRFSPDQPISDIFNWVDATFEMEREKVVLTTMNGQKTLKWDEESNDKTLGEEGLARMTGFRVSEKQEEEAEADDSADS